VRGVLLPLLLAAVSVPALAASNGVPSGPAGTGSASISGYAVSSVSYSLEGERIAGVAFRLSPAGATTVRVRLAPDAPWTPCAVAGGAAECAVDVALGEATLLQVAAASGPA
jgi:hypothetical protein